jgi:ATP dependent DNA ligase domain/PilZ domain
VRKKSNRSLAKSKAEFMEPMECALVPKLPEGPDWTFEAKLDGYRAVGVKTSSDATLYSRNHKNFNKRFPQIAEALGDLPADTVIDGEVVALDESGRPDFHGFRHLLGETPPANARVHRIEHIFVFSSLGGDCARYSLPGELKLQQKPSYPRRFYSRVETRVDVWVYWGLKGREETSRVRDLSMGGLFVETTKSTAVGASVKLDFLVQEGRIGAEAVVRHVKSGGLGLKLSAMGNEDLKRLRALITRLRN